MGSIVERLTRRRCVTAEALSGVSSHPLDQLGDDQVATIIGYASQDVITRRLFDLGFAPGQGIRLLRRAPLRDPLMFRVGGAEIVLRRRDARRILVAA